MSVADIRSQVEAVGTSTAQAAATNLLRQVQQFPDFVAELDKVHFNHAMAKLNTLGLLSVEPRDPFRGEILDVSRLLDQGSPLRPLLAVSGHAGGTIANRFILPPGERPSPQLLASAEPAVAASHLIDEQAQERLAREDWPAFLELRGRSCERTITEHVNRMAEWGARDGRAMADILRPVA